MLHQIRNRWKNNLAIIEKESLNLVSKSYRVKYKNVNKTQTAR